MRVFGMGLAAGLVLGVAATVLGQHLAAHDRPAHQPYAGQQTRQISSLTADDVAQLRKGAGWGLAKPAELNGYPGPAHVLELANQLDLDAGQTDAAQAAFDKMNAQARELGRALIEAEAALDAAFKQGAATPELLGERLAATEKVRAALRAVHLSAHLEVTPLLTVDQKARYAALRGYGDGRHDHGGH